MHRMYATNDIARNTDAAQFMPRTSAFLPNLLFTASAASARRRSAASASRSVKSVTLCLFLAYEVTKADGEALYLAGRVDHVVVHALQLTHEGLS